MTGAVASGLHCHGIHCCWECHHGRPIHPAADGDDVCVRERCYPVSVIVPYRPDGGARDAAWAHVHSLWRRHHPDWQVVEGRAGDGPWCKAAAVADGLERALGQILVIADADVWTEGVPAAVAAVREGAPWAIPHWLVHRLTEAATAAVLAGGRLDGDLGASAHRRLEQPPYPGFPGGGIAVLPRGLYGEVPLDPRFVGWSGEDESWALALQRLAGEPWRGEADLYHLWHPPQPRMSRRWGSRKARELSRRYRAARTSTELHLLLAEIPGRQRVAL